MKNEIIFIKSALPNIKPTEDIALEVLKDEKYDNNPFINKKSIEKALNQYENLLNPLNKEIIPSITDINLNIEGHFISSNISEVSSMVVDDPCTPSNIYNLLDNNDTISHIALSTYAINMDNNLKIIDIIQKEYSHIELLVGGVGAVYPHIQKVIPMKNLCIGEGVNFIRKKLNLKFLNSDDFKIPRMVGNITNLPLPYKAIYMVTQLGCPYNCDFCITPNFYNYSAFSNIEKIIAFFDDLNQNLKKDIFVYLCDPNAFYPERTWKKVFEYLIDKRRDFSKNIFIIGLASLDHINKFDIELIQQKSPIKFLAINYGIESTLDGGYVKNKKNIQNVVDRLNNNSIITYHTCIIGLPIHTPKNIVIDIQNNCKIKSDVISVNTFKPIPLTQIYQDLKTQDRIIFDDIPPEFLYMDGYMPFKHPNLGFGFDILPFAFQAYQETEKELIDVYSNLADKLIDILSLSKSRQMRIAIKILIEFSKKNFQSYKIRMPNHLSKIYQSKLNRLINKYTIM